MVCLPYISCNGTCFVHKIFRLDAIERYIVTIYHIVAKKWFPKVNFQSLYRGFGFVLPHYWVYLSPEGVVLNPEGFVDFNSLDKTIRASDNVNILKRQIFNSLI